MRSIYIVASALAVLAALTGCVYGAVVGGTVAAVDQGGGGAGPPPLPPPPTLFSIEPTFGPQQGGTEVTVLGSGLRAGSLQVFVGGVQLQGVTLVSDAELRGRTSGVANPGPADVVATNGGGSDVLRGAFEFLAPPVISRVTPAESALDGGVAVEIVGSGFVAGTEAAIGGRSLLALEIVGETLISGTVPPSGLPTSTAFAFVDVEVRNSRGAALLPQGFAYFGAPRVTSVSPAAGALGEFQVTLPDGSSFRPAELTIRGVGFLSGTTVALAHGLGAGLDDPAPLAEQRVLSRSTILAAAAFPGAGLHGHRQDAPFGAPVTETAVDVEVSHPLTGATRLAGGFTLLPRPAVTEVFPPFALPGQTVLVRGARIPADVRAFVGGSQIFSESSPDPTPFRAGLDGAEAEVEAVTAGEVRVRVPPSFDPDTIALADRGVTLLSPSAGHAHGGLFLTKWIEFGLVRGAVQDMAVSTATADEVWVATEAGLWRTQDGGATWSRRHGEDGPEPLENLNVTAIALGGGGRVYAVASPGPATVDPARPSGIFRSDDGGATWQEATGNLATVAQPLAVRDVAADPADPDVALAAIVSPTGAIWKTTNGGETWQEASAVALAGGGTIQTAGRVLFSPGLTKSVNPRGGCRHLPSALTDLVNLRLVHGGGQPPRGVRRLLHRFASCASRRRQTSHQKRPSPIRQPPCLPHLGHTKPSGQRSHSR